MRVQEEGDEVERGLLKKERGERETTKDREGLSTRPDVS